MLEKLQEQFSVIIRNLKGEGKITEKNIRDSMREVRRALLEADVNYKVVKEFTSRVSEKAIGEKVLRSITPGQQIVKIIHDELVDLLGKENRPFNFNSVPPTVFMIVGLQGSGKTTLTSKLGNYLRKKGYSPLLVAADIYRPAAEEQLETLGKQINLPVYREGKKVLDRCKSAVSYARKQHHDVLILDTAGRLHIDDKMMGELQLIKRELKPSNIVFVADGMTGQDAVKTATAFNEWLDITGNVLTKMDSDARGGAALSIVYVTGKPILMLGTGEKISDLEVFHPDRFASRILGMGDIVSLVEKAQETIDQEEVLKLEQKIRKNQITLNDFLNQMKQLKKMGPISQFLDMIPGMNKLKLKATDFDESQFVHIEAIIQSMTREEREKPQIINGSRRKRIARGSGTSVNEVNRLLKQFFQMQKMMKKLGKMKIPKNLQHSPLGF